jgi:hypothetical protein
LEVTWRLLITHIDGAHVMKVWENDQISTRTTREMTRKNPDGPYQFALPTSSWTKWNKTAACSLSEEPAMLKLTVVKPHHRELNNLEIRPVDEDSNSGLEDLEVSGDSEISEDEDNAGDDEDTGDEDDAGA